MTPGLACTGHVALTFDDGPVPSGTAALLDALRSCDARATLFNIGRNARDEPGLVLAQRAAGMWLGNHSWSHPRPTTLPEGEAEDELRRTGRMLRRITGTAPRLFRPPYGDTSPSVHALASRLGLTEVLWDVDARDWAGATTDEIVAAADSLTAGQVMLMHDGYPSTVAAVPHIVARLRERGLCPGMISPSTGRAVAPRG
ncbi:polysaccharide deacetylase family protein [Dactylosporangium darangshiense]|uniref:NodB homology domain-containing protein n=1 Tax=Dactylosporangium darangshiense TaxID=579108 RepID=A0ABP8D7K8_9ACTN